VYQRVRPRSPKYVKWPRDIRYRLERLILCSFRADDLAATSDGDPAEHFDRAFCVLSPRLANFRDGARRPLKFPDRPGSTIPIAPFLPVVLDKCCWGSRGNCNPRRGMAKNSTNH